MNNTCSLLIDSCDIYSYMWDVFFELLKKYWGTCPYKIYLNTETKKYKYDGFDITVINSGNQRTWSERLKYALGKIDSDYVLMMEGIICWKIMSMRRLFKIALNGLKKSQI